MYWAGDKAQLLRGVLDRMAPDSDRMKRQVKRVLDIGLLHMHGQELIYITSNFVSPGPTGSSERYHKECQEAH